MNAVSFMAVIWRMTVTNRTVSDEIIRYVLYENLNSSTNEIVYSNAHRADTCPTDEWQIDWLQSLRKYVKPEIASEVEKVVAALSQVWVGLSTVCSAVAWGIEPIFQLFVEVTILFSSPVAKSPRDKILFW